MGYQAVVIGASAGGMEAIRTILISLHENFPAPIIIVQHTSPQSGNYMVEYFNRLCKIGIKEADEKQKILPGNVYIAPPNYHLLVEKDRTLSLTVEPKVNYSRPAIDVLFESAAETYFDELIAVVLTGANSDGSKGLRKVKELGGLAIVQDPSTAEASAMPMAAIDIIKVDFILSLNEIGPKLIELVGTKYE